MEGCYWRSEFPISMASTPIPYELQKATDNYNANLISGFVGPCYKGCLEGRVIFVKKYYDYCPCSFVVDPESVSNEITIAAQVSGHKNALKLLGCCLETPNPTPVFGFPKNGNLDNQLRSNPTSLPWRIRLKIANKIASVITYLHTTFPRPIIHRRIHPTNIHLDQDFSAKLFDFILCMALPKGETQVESDSIIWSDFCMAPEILEYGVYSEKSDVFGFGSILFHLLTGKTCVGKEFGEYHKRSYIRNHTMNGIIDPTIMAKAEAARGGEGVHHQFLAVFGLILKCLRDSARRGQLCWMLQNNTKEFKGTIDLS